jgi:hypothetical protein
MLLFLVYRVKTKLLHLTGFTVHPNISCSANIRDNSEVQATCAAQLSSRIDTDKMVMGWSRIVIDHQQHHQHSSTEHQLFKVAERSKSSYFQPVPSQLSLPDLCWSCDDKIRRWSVCRTRKISLATAGLHQAALHNQGLGGSRKRRTE